ncbi:E3 ubiquitin/ISG15 ligase TRIM25-like [Limanda limanda]|uniref:E3 ubiquitin/ISG15 ligase TRIM25-like n=1 Tax=Limanda limanda TaxID=27771 RepID=UPI0029C6C37B|nr:E3 ubiquitin/ISG15 ligase TRIM25-like [Limanda limanda]
MTLLHTVQTTFTQPLYAGVTVYNHGDKVMFCKLQTILQSLAPGEIVQQENQLDRARFCCSICLDILKDPVTIGCGHSYCMICLKTHWDNEDKRIIYSCPQCRMTFRPRPVLVKNIMFADLVEELKKTGLQADPADHCYARPEDVACDVCTGRKLKALKSCLVCLASYCEKHLLPHFQSSPFKKHKLVEPSKELQENICPHHNEGLMLYRTEQQCICYFCFLDEHKAAEERTERQRDLGLRRQTIQQRLQDRENYVKLLQQVEEAVNEKIYTELIRLVENRTSDELQERLELEINELKRKDELKQLSNTEEHNQFLNNNPTLSPLRESTHSSSISIRPLRYFEDVTAVSQVIGQLQDILSETKTKISQIVSQVDVLLPQPEPNTRADFLKYSQEITLDPYTANKHLLLSEGNRKVTVISEEQSYSNHPDRFNYLYQVLSRESLTVCCYWEVEWRGRGVEVAVAYKNINRAEDTNECIFGHNDKSWSLDCDENSYSVFYNNLKTPVSGPPSSRIGVYLDHSAGVLSFYSVSDTMTLLHRVHTTFTQPLYAGVRVYCYGVTAEVCKLK